MVQAFLITEIKYITTNPCLKSMRMFRIEVTTFPVLLFNSYWQCYAMLHYTWSQDLELQETEL